MTFQSRNLDKPDEIRKFTNGEFGVVTVSGTIVGRAVFQPGWRWSNDVKPVAGTDDRQYEARDGHLGRTERQIEAARIAMTRFIKRGGKVWIRVFPDKPITKKPAETRMGKGKGAPEEWVAVVRPGKILFEMEGVPTDVAQEAMRLASHKLPIKTQFVQRPGGATHA